MYRSIYVSTIRIVLCSRGTANKAHAITLSYHTSRGSDFLTTTATAVGVSPQLTSLITPEQFDRWFPLWFPWFAWLHVSMLPCPKKRRTSGRWT